MNNCNVYRMLKKIVNLILFALLLQSCTRNTHGVFSNSTIDRRTREEIKALNDKLFRAIHHNDPRMIEKMVSDSFANRSMDEIGKMVETLNTSYTISGYNLFDEFYIVNNELGMEGVIESPHSDDNGYILNYKAPCKETYLSLLSVPVQKGALLLVAEYGKYNNEWKLNTLQYGQYSLFGKNASEYFKLAKNCYERSYLIDAVNFMMASNTISTPVNEVFHYKKDKEMHAFYSSVMKAANTKYRLPFTLENIESKPRIYKMAPQLGADGFYQAIYYVSSIGLDNIEALKTENEKIKKEVVNQFAGIDQYKDYIFYWAVNEMPDSQKMIEQYGFVDTLKTQSGKEFPN